MNISQTLAQLLTPSNNQYFKSYHTSNQIIKTPQKNTIHKQSSIDKKIPDKLKPFSNQIQHRFIQYSHSGQGPLATPSSKSHHPLFSLQQNKSQMEKIKSQNLRKIFYQNRLLNDDMKKMKQLQLGFQRVKQQCEKWKKIAQKYKNSYQKVKKLNRQLKQNLKYLHNNNNDSKNNNMNELKDLTQICSNNESYLGLQKSKQQSEQPSLDLQMSKLLIQYVKNIEEEQTWHKKLQNEQRYEQEDLIIKINKQQQESKIWHSKYENIKQELKKQKKLRVFYEDENYRLKQQLKQIKYNKSEDNPSIKNKKLYQQILLQNFQLKQKLSTRSQSTNLQKKNIDIIRQLFIQTHTSTHS